MDLASSLEEFSSFNFWRTERIILRKEIIGLLKYIVTTYVLQLSLRDFQGLEHPMDTQNKL